MRYSVSQYSSALVEAFGDKPAGKRREVVRNFFAILRKNKDGAKLGRIIKEAEKQHLRSRGLRKVEVRSASLLSESVKKEVKEIFGKKIFLEERLSPDLLGGIRILIDEETIIDASAKRRLGLLFKKKLI